MTKGIIYNTLIYLSVSGARRVDPLEYKRKNAVHGIIEILKTF
jgi:hypothetical protein